MVFKSILIGDQIVVIFEREGQHHMCKALLFGVRVNAHLHPHESQASQLHSDVEHFGLACTSFSFNHILQGHHSEALTSYMLATWPLHVGYATL